MNTADIRCTREVEDKLLDKHGVTLDEVAEVLKMQSAYRRTGRDGHGDMRYTTVGQTESGRWLFVVFVLNRHEDARIVSAREATRQERRKHGR